IKAYGEGDISKAYSILSENNIFPEMCALICPVEVQCKGACVENIFSRRPVAISEIQQAIAKEARVQGLVKISVPKDPSGKKVAIVGAGPAGMACAAKLLQFGHHIEIFEKASTLGGIPGTVIPFERIDSQIVLNEINSLFNDAKEKRRLAIQTDFPFNSKNNIESIRQNFDAVFLGFGLSVSMQLPGVASRPKGVIDALSYLRSVKSNGDTETGKIVAVLGGGNTAIDAAVTAREQGAQDVYIVYRRSFNEMPAWQKDRDDAMEKSIHFLILSQPLDYVERNGALVGLKIIQTQLGEPDESGRRRPEIIPGSEYVLNVDQVIEAIGQRMDDDTKKALGIIELNKSGWIKVDDCYRTSLTGVFAGGDVINGGATAVQAVVDGMKTAEEIHKVFNSK
ncbi:NAD(P)-binding protein, partial [candidate division KSB1 bacterium]|nr:NAD(P)-binding protein [candidate division KSB1 bacterium]